MLRGLTESSIQSLALLCGMEIRWGWSARPSLWLSRELRRRNGTARGPRRHQASASGRGAELLSTEMAWLGLGSTHRRGCLSAAQTATPSQRVRAAQQPCRRSIEGVEAIGSKEHDQIIFGDIFLRRSHGKSPCLSTDSHCSEARDDVLARVRAL